MHYLLDSFPFIQPLPFHKFPAIFMIIYKLNKKIEFIKIFRFLSVKLIIKKIKVFNRFREEGLKKGLFFLSNVVS